MKSTANACRIYAGGSCFDSDFFGFWNSGGSQRTVPVRVRFLAAGTGGAEWGSDPNSGHGAGAGPKEATDLGSDPNSAGRTDCAASCFGVARPPRTSACGCARAGMAGALMKPPKTNVSVETNLYSSYVRTK